jgi:hypothetical protein
MTCEYDDHDEEEGRHIYYMRGSQDERRRLHLLFIPVVARLAAIVYGCINGALRGGLLCHVIPIEPTKAFDQQRNLPMIINIY